MTTGLVYIATGQKFIAEAERSVASFKALMPDLPAALFKDADSVLSTDARFDTVRLVSQPAYGCIDKIMTLKDSPFERTLFLDTDTHCVAPCQELFELLDRFDYAAAHAPVRTCWEGARCPRSFPELNTGVILYQNNDRFGELVDSWFGTYQQHLQLAEPPPHDQPAFREAAFRSSARLSVLPPEYNLRTCFSYFIGGNAQVKILHGRGRNLADALAVVGKSGSVSKLPRTVVWERPVARQPVAQNTPGPPTSPQA